MKLSRRKARAEVTKLVNWALRGQVISRKFKFSDFAAAMRFVNRVARLAEAANHHPDITINYNRVRLALTTHDEGGLTMKDFRLAGKINRFAK
ncbi:MAG: 4a-hydroxytetrahydrobiopterin dehydratase [Candidatus Bathyarchaeia archaeon]|jgi:4a-hydroxytetrahydrobiopterin dehydratase